MTAANATLALEEFRLIRGLILQYCGVLLTDDQRTHAERRLRERLAVLGLSDFRSYYRHLRFGTAGATEIEDAAEAITTHETYFFREEYQLDAFRDEILPDLYRSRAATRRLAIWSAGCSTGEEPYTLAMILLEAGIPAGWDVRVFGSDLSRRVVAHARRGVYSRSAFRACPDVFKRTYFTQTSEGLAVNGHVRALCNFVQLNLIDASRIAMIGRIDAIFCRNVLIYLDPTARRSVIDQFHRRLLPGGVLLLGHSESLLASTTSFEPMMLSTDLAYRRCAASESSMPAAPSIPPGGDG